MLSLFQGIGGATGPLTAGYIYDATGTYHRAFIIFLVLFVVAAVVILMVRRPQSGLGK